MLFERKNQQSGASDFPEHPGAELVLDDPLVAEFSVSAEQNNSLVTDTRSLVALTADLNEARHVPDASFSSLSDGIKDDDVAHDSEIACLIKTKSTNDGNLIIINLGNGRIEARSEH